MNVLIIGVGGREHAIGWAVSQSQDLEHLYFATGNAGTATMGSNIDIEPGETEKIISFCLENRIGLVIVGPEQPLVQGMADRLRDRDIPVMGPSARAARLEGSKSFSKDFMRRHDIPTAEYRVFRSGDLDAAIGYVEAEGAPIVVKASGLAGGKGAIVCETVEDARNALCSLMKDRSLGSAADEVVIESFMVGEEASIFVVADGETFIVLPSAQDHKRIGDNDTGPNTGGMGAYAPAPVMTSDLLEEVRKEIIEPTLAGMISDGDPYHGILYCGLMMTRDGPRVVEYNCRLGDPETQVVLPLLKSDVLELFYRCATGSLNEYRLEVDSGAAACVVMASAGYPGLYKTGMTIQGLGLASDESQTMVFHAGTRMEQGEVVTSGGRVLSVACLGSDLEGAIQLAYSGCEQIQFEGARFRTDIGQKGLARLTAI